MQAGNSQQFSANLSNLIFDHVVVLQLALLVILDLLQSALFSDSTFTSVGAFYQLLIQLKFQFGE